MTNVFHCLNVTVRRNGLEGLYSDPGHLKNLGQGRCTNHSTKSVMLWKVGRGYYEWMVPLCIGVADGLDNEVTAGYARWKATGLGGPGWLGLVWSSW